MLDLVRGGMSVSSKAFSQKISRAILIILKEYSASLVINIISLNSSKLHSSSELSPVFQTCEYNCVLDIHYTLEYLIGLKT